MRYLIALSAGIFSVVWWPMLPDLSFVIVVLASTTLLSIKLPLRFKKSVWVALCMGWGCCWAIFSAQQYLQHQLPEVLNKQEIIITGSVDSLVETNRTNSRFSMAVESARLKSNEAVEIPIKSVLLSWYQFKGPRTQISPGERWQLTVRLRRPRGFRNPGAFDYQSWLIQQGYSATGYIRESASNKRIDSVPISIDRYRQKIRQAIMSSGLSPRGAAAVLALSIGDKNPIGQWWDDLARLGIVHLLVISGLHIGLIAGLGFKLGTVLGRLILPLHWLFPSRVDQTLGSRWMAPVMALMAGLAYSLLAGFSLSTQRAIIAVSVVMIAKLLYRRVDPWACFLWALLLIAIAQPLAILNAGFWLSFSAVAVLIWWFNPWQSTGKSFSYVRALSAQLALLVAMALPLLFFMGRFSWLAPMVNLLAVPWVSLVTVPLTLIGTVLLPLSSGAASLCWQLASDSLSWLWLLLDWLPRSVGFVSAPVTLSAWLLAATLLAVLGALLPKGLSVRRICGLPLLAAILGSESGPPLKVTVLDVGQGLAVVVQSPDHLLVYDSGPSYSDQFNAGSGIIAPYLRRHGRNRIDQLILSHEDADHSGGFNALLAAIGVNDIQVGPGYGSGTLTHCIAGTTWYWGEGQDRVRFDILSPSSGSFQKGNNSSCVLMITWRDQRILLSGDIEAEVEQQLDFNGHPLSLLVAPHHGSKTSSSPRFVAATQPTHVVFSSGYGHQFGHPHADVVQRYMQVDSAVWLTSEQGAVSFTWDRQGQLNIATERSLQPDRWWR